MASYKIEFKRSSEQDIRKISPPIIVKILEKIELLTTDPFPRQSLKLSGSEAVYRLRVGDYRVIYEVDPVDMLVIVHYVRHRKDAYRKF